jgi:hypothetical protein
MQNCAFSSFRIKTCDKKSPGKDLRGGTKTNRKQVRGIERSPKRKKGIKKAQKSKEKAKQTQKQRQKQNSKINPKQH